MSREEAQNSYKCILHSSTPEQIVALNFQKNVLQQRHFVTECNQAVKTGFLRSTPLVLNFSDRLGHHIINVHSHIVHGDNRSTALLFTLAGNL